MRNSESSNPCPKTQAIFMVVSLRRSAGAKMRAAPGVRSPGRRRNGLTAERAHGSLIDVGPAWYSRLTHGGGGCMALVLAVVNQKGGVGKTTTAVNLAASLAAREHEVLLVDLDPQGNATSGIGIPRDRSERPTIYHALLGEADARSAVLPTEVPHLFVLPSGADLVGA